MVLGERTPKRRFEHDEFVKNFNPGIEGSFRSFDTKLFWIEIPEGHDLNYDENK